MLVEIDGSKVTLDSYDGARTIGQSTAFVLTSQMLLERGSLRLPG